MMQRLLLACVVAGLAAPVILVAPLSAQASEAEIRLESAPMDVRDAASLQSGARTFVNYCLNCHSASLLRYNRLMDIDLTDRQIVDNLMFSATKVGEMMNIAMT